MNEFIDQVRRDGKAAYSEKCVKRVELMFEKNERYEEYLELYRWLGENENSHFGSACDKEWFDKVSKIKAMPVCCTV